MMMRRNLLVAFLALLPLSSVAEKAQWDFLGKLKDPISTLSSFPAASVSQGNLGDLSEDVDLSVIGTEQKANPSIFNVEQVPSDDQLADPQDETEDEEVIESDPSNSSTLSSYAEVADQQDDSEVEEVTAAHLRHRQLGEAGLIKPVFINNKKCVDRAGDNLILHSCHGNWNQKFAFQSDTNRILVGGYCWDYNEGNGNLFTHKCHGGSNQKFSFDNRGRIQVKGKCVDLDGTNLVIRSCSSAESQRWYLPYDFPQPRSEIKPFYNNNQCFDKYSDNNLYIYGQCHGKKWQQFYWSAKDENIFTPRGNGCIDENSKGNVYIYPCHDGNNQRWWRDNEGRIHNRKDPNRCLESDGRNNENLRMASCSKSDRQRFVVPESFPRIKSPVVSASDSKCWDAHTSTKSIFLNKCHSGSNQQFMYTPESERIMIDRSGFGCVDVEMKSMNVQAHSCHNGKNQKFFMDNKGRLHSRELPKKCLGRDRDNLVLKDCEDSLDQIFILPVSFVPKKANLVKAFFDTNLCWDVHAEKGHVYLHGCHGKQNQSFLYMPDTKKILLFFKGRAQCMDAKNEGDVRANTCDAGASTEWFLDDKGRLHNGKHSSKCLTANKKDNWRFIMEDCGGKDSQRFVYPDGFPTRASSVKPYYDNTLCWELNPMDGSTWKNLAIGACDSRETSQQFYFVPESERIINPSGLCMDDNYNDVNRNVYFHSCHSGNNQKWFVDGKGRIHSRHDGKCLDLNPVTRNLYMNDCKGDETQNGKDYECPQGYERRVGDLPGWGNIGSQKTSKKQVKRSADCGKWCAETQECRSFEWSPTSHICNLNEEPEPTKSAYKDYIFCSLKEELADKANKSLLFGPEDTSHVKNWLDAISFCEDKGMRLATQDEWCADGKTGIFGGQKKGDQWTAVADYINGWIQVGEWNKKKDIGCQTHEESHSGVSPTWGMGGKKEAFENNYILCSPSGLGTFDQEKTKGLKLFGPKDTTLVTDWLGAISFCEKKGMRLASQDEWCSGGLGKDAILGGQRKGDQWTAVSDYEDGWVQVGEWYAGNKRDIGCQTNKEVFGVPTWTNDGKKQEWENNYVLCAPSGLQVFGESEEDDPEDSNTLELFGPKDTPYVKDWTGALSFCERRGMRLASRAEWCSGGLGKDSILGGQRKGDQWTAVADYINGWIQVGEWNGHDIGCQTHEESHDGRSPAWSSDGKKNSYESNFVLCAMSGLELFGDTQRFLYARSFRTVTSPVAPYADLSKCWEIDPESRNLHLAGCTEETKQDFYYMPETEHVVVASGQGCLENHPETLNVYASQCDTSANQKWYLDAAGRFHSRHDDTLCLGKDEDSNLHMEPCTDSLIQRFSFPNSFPIVSTDAKTAFAKRQELNSFYGEVDRQIYGKETRSILRYQHPDQVQRNLCPYWESSFVFDTTMQNYKISTRSVIEVIYTDDMKQILYGGAKFEVGTEASFMVTKPMNVLRPRQVEGYFRLGDYLSNKVDGGGVFSAPLVKGDLGTVLKKPIDFVLVSNTTSATIVGAFWKPIAPAGFVCLGHVWQTGVEKPSTSTIRCVQEHFVEKAPSALTWDNSEDGQYSGEDASLWAAGSTANSITPGTFISKASHSAPAAEEFWALKKQCILGLGSFPFCGKGDNMNLAVDRVKEFSLPYAKLRPCYYQDEDQGMYGLVNDASSKWENFAFELHEYGSGSVGYKQVGASKDLGTPHCLGSVVFGSSTIKNDLFVHTVPKIGSVSKQEADDQKNGRIGNRMSELIDGDFVFLFPCSDTNELKDYKKTLQQLAKDANKDGLTSNGFANDGEDFGEVVKFGDSKWKTPHHCGLLEEPNQSGGCRMVDACFFEPGGCKPYDQLPCTEDAECKGGHCGEDGLCGKNVRLYAESSRSSTFEKLPRALSYGVGQDGPGRFLVQAEGNRVQLSGNTWKAFPVKHTVTYNTVLEFDFRLVDEAEGHAICLDEDLNEDVEIQGAKRCFRLAGTQKDVWTEVWSLDGPGNTGEFKHYKIPIGSIVQGPGGDEPYISWGAHIEYLAVVQDNDENESVGLSVFRNLQLYDDSEMPLEIVDPGPVITGESITVDVLNTNKKGKWKVECTRLDGSVPDQPPQRVYKHDGSAFNSNSAQTYQHRLDGLLPGFEYTINVYPDGKTDQAQKTIASTHCCCDCDSIIVGDTTGRPIGLKAYQVQGHVLFNFTDNSRCAEAYAFTRSELEDEFFDNSDETRKSVFTPNYAYYPKKKCGKAPVLPGKAASDDLSVSKLEVGAAYRYCVRAVAQFYSADSLHSSDENCNIHYVRWQASLSGKITTEPMAGSLPIEDVAVSWELLNPDQTLVIASGSAVTKRPGTFSIVFDELHKSLDRDSEFPVRIKFAKTTVVGEDHIKHQFLCNEGSLDCTDDGHIVYLKHLTFDEPIVSYDNSSVPVRGRVTIWEPDGCPVIGAEVCLKIKHTRAEDTTGACVKTDHNGDYNVPAAIGSTVGVEVTYYNHTITKAPENSIDYGTGMFIRVDKRYERNDFVDVAKATLVVEVAGGMCNKTLGTSSVELTVNGCQADHWKMDLSQQFFKGEHWVPAHVLQLKVREMSDEIGNDFSKIMELFSTETETKTINLLEAGDVEEEAEGAKTVDNEISEEEKKSSEEKIDKVRFQYDGDLQIQFQFMGVDMAGDCTLDTVTPQGKVSTDQQTTSSLHITPTGSTFRPHVFLKYDLLPDLTCDIVADDHSVRVINKVGIDNDFDAYAPTLQDKGALLERLKLCSDDGGCNFPIQHDTFNGEKTNANMIPTSEDGTILSFVAGRPNIYADFRKDLTVEVLGKDRNIIKRHKAEVVVVGDYVKGPGASFALPTYEPILVLRDPPGGKSQATYENVQTTVKVKSSTVERVLDTEFGFKNKIGASGEVDMCAGFGAMACKDVLKISGGANYGVDISGNTKVTQNEDSYTSEFTTTWSYSTSDDPVRAGRSSDVIVIPNLNVQYHTVEKIAFYEEEACKVNNTETVKFSLTDPGNKPALSFLSVYNIENDQIPELEDAIASKKAEHDKLEKGDSNKDKVKAQQKVLEDALVGWKRTMNAYEKTSDMASKGKLDIVAREWFSKWASKHDMLSHEPSITDHWANLAPESLTDSAVAFDFDYIKKANLKSTDKDDLKQTNRIQFSGGGGTMEFKTHHKGASEILRLDPDHLNKELSVNLGLGGEFELEAGATVGTELSSGFKYTDSSSATIKDEAGRETTISFVLGDEQPNDEFVVDIYVDPRYGTFVFHTVSGCSMAPWEANTLKGEDLRISMERPTQPVMPDEAIVFDLTIGNDGESLAVFECSVDQTSNPGGLRHYLGGVGVEGAVEYQMDSRSEVTTTLEITRGPKDYIYPATTIEFGGAWDDRGIEAAAVELWNYQDEEGNKWIKFAEPCPRIEWAGSLKREMRASVIKDIEPVRLTIFNPRKADGSLESLAKTSRLKNVLVLYRELGDTDWNKAQFEDLTPIDFAHIPTDKDAWKESIYGYSNVPWDIGKILALTADGTYEVIVKSYCTELSGAPAEFNAYATDPITLVVDRVQPELYGKALPVRDIVVPGEEVAMVFTESIRCGLPYRFDLQVRVAGLEDRFDDRNLKIDCKDRKLGFQFDPVRIKYDLLMGKEMTVTVTNVQDLEGNPIPNKITFKKTIANLNLDDVSTSFDFIMKTKKCNTPINEGSIRETIAAELALSDPGRVSIVSSSCDGKHTVAEVKIGSSGPSQRRLRTDQQIPTALDAFYSLVDGATAENEAGARRLLIQNESVEFEVANMEIIPGESDTMKYDLDADPTPEEEIIMAAAEGCDSNHLEQRQNMLRMEQSMREHMNETQSHMDRKAEETASHIDELETHLEMLDHKLDRLLGDMPPTEVAITNPGSKPQDEEDTLKKSELTDLLIRLEEQQEQMRLEQKQTQRRMEQQQTLTWELCFGFCAFAAVVAFLYARPGRHSSLQGGAALL